MEEKENEVIEKNEEVKEKKGKNILKYFLFVILVGCLCAGCFFLGTTFTSSIDDKKDGNDKVTEETNEKEEDIQIEQLTKDSAVVKKLFEIFREDKNCMMASVWESYEELDAKKYIAYAQLEENDFKNMVCNELDKQTFDYYTCNIDSDFSQNVKTFSADSLKNKYVEIFGSTGYVDGDFKIGEGPIAYYDNLNKVYAEFSCFCGGDCGIGFDHVLDSIEQNGTKLILNTRLVHDKKYYEDLEIDYDLKDVSIVFTFEYEKETGNYIFVSRVVK